nr:TrkA C-terminal domain-containing protein [Marinicella sp. W31]MDC2878908.1 TrkA C-terminal domain-containing protein [Marinicella sp. W31]
MIGPKLLNIKLAAACQNYIKRSGGDDTGSGLGTAWHQYVARAYRIEKDSALAGLTVAQAEIFFGDHRLFLARLRRGEAILEATTNLVLEDGDVVAFAGSRHVLLSEVRQLLPEVDDSELLGVPVEGTDILITARDIQHKTLEELAVMPETRGIFLTAIHRGAMSVSVPVLADTRLYRGDVVRVLGRPADISAAAKEFGYLDRETERADIAFIAAAIAIGALIGALTLKIGPAP